MKKYLLWGCGGFLIFGFLASCAIFAIATDTDDPATKAASSTASKQKQYKIGDTVKASDLEYKILNVEAKKSIKSRFGGEYKPGAGQYLIIELEIKNTGKEKVTADSNMFKIKDNDGAEYTADSQVDTWINGTGSDSLGFFLKPINPHATKSGKVAFDVPEKKIEEFTFEGQAGMFSLDDPAVIKLVK